MNIGDILIHDPAKNPLANQGQARLDSATSELQSELRMFVCEGEYADGIYKILTSYLTNLQHTSQKGAWVSGFFGSGKSHLLKMLWHLWQNTEFADGSNARSLVRTMPDFVSERFRELDTEIRRAGGVAAIAGSMPSGPSQSVRLTILGFVLRAAGLPAAYAPAKFCLWLREREIYDEVEKYVEGRGKEFLDEVARNLWVSPAIAQALLVSDPSFAPNETEARKTLRTQFSQPADIDTAEFLSITRRALLLRSESGRLPCTIVILDEVQQFIDQSNERGTQITEIAEALSKQMDSKVIVVGAGQSALTDVPHLHKLMDRFTIRVPLTDTDVETVTRRVVLEKKPTALAEVRSLLDRNAGEVSRHLNGTRIGETSDDRNTILEDYPLLPVRRRFWEECFRQLDAAGTHSQLRSQLRILHDVLAKLSNRRVGAAIPGDELYEALAAEMVNTAVLSREINERIIAQSKDGTPDAILSRRICGLVFLIGRLNEKRADLGVRARPDHIADLLVDDLAADSGKLRSEVDRLITKLVSDGVLMPIGDEVRIQTKEGAEWDRDFKARQAKLRGDETSIHMKQQALLNAQIERVVRGVRLAQGVARQRRELLLSYDQTPPPVTGDMVPVWVRDQWSMSQNEFLSSARAAGTDSSIIFVFIEKRNADGLRKLVIDAEAASEVLAHRGVPTGDDGKEAHRSMKTRLDNATAERDKLVASIVAAAKVFQGGGSEVLHADLPDKLVSAADASLIRLFPQFGEADAPAAAWETAIRRAREGADQPFMALNYTGTTEQHPVCRRVLGAIGSGSTGTQIQKALEKSPYGFPRDAVDAALIALHRLQHITATLNTVPVPPGQLDQNKIKKSEFRLERATLTQSDRLKVRGLFNQLEIKCKKDEEAAKAPEFLSAVLQLAHDAGGDAPLPIRPASADVDDLRRLIGNEQLAELARRHDELRTRIEAWKQTRDQIEKRLGSWTLAERLASHAATLPSAREALKEIVAIRDGRLLLASTDPASAARASLARELRAAVNATIVDHESAWTEAMATLDASGAWQQVTPDDRNEILAACELVRPTRSDISSDEALISALDRMSLSQRRAEIDAVRSRTTRALNLAAQKLEPRVRAIAIERTTLRTREDVVAWTERQQKKLLDAIADGPVLID